MTINRKGIDCHEISVDEFKAQMSGAALIDSTEQVGYTELHYATDDYDLYVFDRDNESYRWFSNRDVM